LLYAVTNPVTQPLQQLLLWLNGVLRGLPLPGSVSSWALTLILIAIIMNIVILPLTVSQRRSMRAMQDLQPKLKELQSRHKDDREKLAQAQMDLYREHGVSPFGGCLPLIIQMVVLIGLYSAIRNLTTELEGQPFLWVPNLAKCEPSPLCPADAGMGIPILIILMVVAQFGYQKFATPPASDPQAKAMSQTMMLMPLMLAFFFAKAPAGIVLYYTAFTLVSVALQAYITRRWQTPVTQAVVPATATADAQLPLADDSAGQEERKADEQSQPRRRRRKKSR
jgi:YidC/Oxa1 family membrane protein insertase